VQRGARPLPGVTAPDAAGRRDLRPLVSGRLPLRVDAALRPAAGELPRPRARRHVGHLVLRLQPPPRKNLSAPGVNFMKQAFAKKKFGQVSSFLKYNPKITGSN
jgi:hypothetical protein